MCANLFWLRLIACLVLATSSVICFETKRLYRVGRRIDGDQLLVKDVLHSRPAGAGELPRVTFTYEIQEPIICVDILSDEVSAGVKNRIRIFLKIIWDDYNLKTTFDIFF